MTGKPKHLMVAVGIVERAGRVLITRRPNDVALPGLWEFPGGKIEPGETPEAAVVRELHEELGITVVPIGRLALIDHEYPHARVTLTPIRCRHTAGEPQPIHCTALRWVTPAELVAYAFPAANATLLNQLATGPLQNAEQPDSLTHPNRAISSAG